MKTTIRSTVAGLVIAFVLSSCCSLGTGASKGRFTELKARHVMFVESHTGRPKKWDEAKFNAEVAEVSAVFDRQEKAEQCAPRKQAIRNSKVIFEKDAAVVRQQHYFSTAGAANTKKQLDLNYDQFTK